MDPAPEPAAPKPAAHSVPQRAPHSAPHPAAPAPHPAAPAALRFPTTPRSRFDAALVRRHLREAAEFAQHCQRAGEPLLDPCGPRGDLYFLLKALLEQPQGRARAAPVAGAEGLTV
jgi:hypothetical protein